MHINLKMGVFINFFLTSLQYDYINFYNKGVNMLLNEIIIDENNMGFIPSLGVSYQLNDSAKEIINLIKQGKSKDEIVKTISQSKNERWQDIYIDVDDFFKKLTIYGLL